LNYPIIHKRRYQVVPSSIINIEYEICTKSEIFYDKPGSIDRKSNQNQHPYEKWHNLRWLNRIFTKVKLLCLNYVFIIILYGFYHDLYDDFIMT